MSDLSARTLQRLDALRGSIQDVPDELVDFGFIVKKLIDILADRETEECLKKQ